MKSMSLCIRTVSQLSAAEQHHDADSAEIKSKQIKVLHCQQQLPQCKLSQCAHDAEASRAQEHHRCRHSTHAAPEETAQQPK
jgi:hypothetical protein